MTTNEQLELGFRGLQHRAPGGKSEDRMVRAAWWFAQMRGKVADAMDWQSAGPTQFPQTYSNTSQTK
jgi:hypothetical protein